MDEQRKEELAKKLYESTRSLQKMAARIDAALTAQEERKEFTQMVKEERAKQDAKKRTFAYPQNSDEAYAKLPSLEQLANGRTQPDSDKWKTKDEILENGTLIEKLRLFFASIDLDGYFGTKGKLTKKEKAKIAASFRTMEDRALADKSSKEYSALMEYGQKLQFSFKRFQVSYSSLAALLNKLDEWEERAEAYSQIFYLIREDGENYKMEETAEWAAAMLQKIVLHVTKIESEGVKFFFDGASKQIKVHIDGERGLYSQIKKEAKEVTKALADFKAFAVVAEDFFEASTLQYMPTIIKMSIENAEEERYARYMVRNLSYFRSNLNERKEEGKTITQEEEAKAVIPDYYEVEPSKDMFKGCKLLMKSLMS